MSKDVATHSINKKTYFVVGFFFLVYLVIGLSIYRHYGLSWDELYQRNLGVAAREYVAGNSQSLLEAENRYHGQFFNMLKIQAEYTLNALEYPEILFVDHLVNFLLFYAAVFIFFLLGKRRFGSWQAGLLGSTFLVLSPVIFSHSFYNPKDIPFLAFFTFAVFTLSLVEEKPKLWLVVIHALFSAAAIGSRVPGIIIPVLTISVLVLRQFSDNQPERLPWKRLILLMVIYLVIVIGGTILLYPVVWQDIFSQFTEAFKVFQSYENWNSSMLFMGQIITSENIPWYYLPVSIAVTTPPLYLFLFISGCLYAGFQLLRKPLFQFTAEKRSLLVDLAWFFGPLIVIIIGHSIVYDSWRHVFFIYPAFLLISLRGLLGLHTWLKQRWSQKGALTIFIVILTISFSATSVHIIQTHPLEHIYFNFLAGPDLKTAAQRFEMDYWGLSYRQALEYFYENDSAEHLKIKAANRAGEFSITILNPEAARQLEFVEDIRDADYYVTNMPDDIPADKEAVEVYAVSIKGVKIAVVYQLH